VKTIRGVHPQLGCVLTGFRLEEPFVQNGCPRPFSYDAVYGQILILLVVLDRSVRGRAKLAILDQDWKATPLVEHELKMFNYRWAALGPGVNFQHWEAKGNLNVGHLLLPFSLIATGHALFFEDSPLSLRLRCI
jgi:hypothetical protein